MKKVLVLSCGTGGGHNSAALAIVEKLNKEGILAEFKEYLEIINPKLSTGINKLYIKSTIGNGKIFKKVYRLGELYDDRIKIKSPVYALNQLSKKKLYNYIIENNYEYIVTTHLFAAQALTAIKKEKAIHFIAIATDYRCIPFWKETNPDYFVIPHQDLKDDFISKGIKEDKLKSIGIPVSENFNADFNKEKIIAELNLKNNQKYILVMSGSMGFGNILELTDKLEKSIDDNTNIIVACGNNQKLLQELNNRYHLNEKVIAIGFTNKIYQYMKISEVLLTKPGGLTTTEAATINIPIIHTMPIPGCENYNANFFADRKMSIKCNHIEEIILNINQILNNKTLKEEMIKNQANNINKNACKEICELIIDELHKINKMNN